MASKPRVYPFAWSELEDPPLTTVQKRYLEEFDGFMRERNPEHREAARARMRNLIDLMQLDCPGK